MKARVPGGANQLEPLLSIGAMVAELHRAFPDVTHSSLRFLEREGLITATRTPGGHRLYTHADVERVRQIKTWQAQRLMTNLAAFNQEQQKEAEKLPEKIRRAPASVARQKSPL